MTVKEIAAACGARISNADPDAVVLSVAVDSRAVAPGSLFVALAGERADGHAFVEDAVRGGAVAALVGTGFDGAVPTLRVDHVMSALGAIAGEARTRLRARVAAITGSSGKTCTKDFLAAACATERRTIASERSFNNELGVPLTILTADEDTEALICEIGSRGIGHIAALMPIVRPDVAVVTNVGAAHAGMFGSIEATATAKGELVESLDQAGTAVLNADDDRVRAMADRAHANVVMFGRASNADVRATDVTLDEHARPSFTLHLGDWGTAQVRLPVPGEHMVSNALAAAAAARACGVSIEGIVRGLEDVRPSAWRMEVVEAGALKVINDAYNANPDSMIAALKALVAMGRGRTTWAVLGPMAELGSSSVEEHDRIGRMAVRLGVARLIVVGDEAKATFEAARHEGMPPQELRWFATADEALAHLKASLEPNAIVLVKASRASGFEAIAHALALAEPAS